MMKDVFEQGRSYKDYFDYCVSQLKEGKSTNDNHSEAFLGYMRLGISRMKRGMRQIEVSENLIAALNTTNITNWLVISEGWCGDAGNILPLFEKCRELNLNLSIILRDTHPEIMDQYLTNGSRSIPMLIGFDNDFNEKFVWGPRPAYAQNMAMEHKSNPQTSQHDFYVRLQQWYTSDKSDTIQKELVELLAV